MADNRVVIITDDDFKAPDTYDSITKLFAVLACVSWDVKFFNENIVDLINGSTVNHEGVDYKFYTMDAFLDLDLEDA